MFVLTLYERYFSRYLGTYKHTYRKFHFIIYNKETYNVNMWRNTYNLTCDKKLSIFCLYFTQWLCGVSQNLCLPVCQVSSKNNDIWESRTSFINKTKLNPSLLQILKKYFLKVILCQNQSSPVFFMSYYWWFLYGKDAK